MTDEYKVQEWKLPCGAMLKCEHTPLGRQYYLDDKMIWKPSVVHRVALQAAILKEDEFRYYEKQDNKDEIL